MALQRMNIRETENYGRLSPIPCRVLLFITVAMYLFYCNQFLNSNLEGQPRKLENSENTNFADYFSHAIDPEGANFGYSIDSYYDANSETFKTNYGGRKFGFFGL